jgi:NAD(P)-dependent dehydrogenase (short-subunit alcohol dehydrogenase family)
LHHLEDKICVVTGAAGAIGSKTVEVMRREGALVAGVDIAGEVDADAFFRADVTDEERVEALYREVADRFGRIDVLFNGVGGPVPGDRSILETDREAWNRALEFNLTSVFLCCKYGIPHLLAAGGGSVINTSSLVAAVGSATSQIAYTAAKGGVLAMSRELGVQFASRNIRVNALLPGPVDTDLLRRLFPAGEKVKRLVHIPTGRFAKVEEIAQAVAFLASDASSYINATEFRVDGGIAAAYLTEESEPIA